LGGPLTLHIERAAHGEAAAVQNMRIDHRGLNIFVAEEFCPCSTPPHGVGGPLGGYSSDVVTGFEQMGGEGIEKLFDVGDAQVLRMTLAVKKYIAFDPIDVGVFSAATVMFEAAGIADLTVSNDTKIRVSTYLQADDN
jgi:hypothetical protein